ncbi:unnamed protein product [Moneuplotes crassus]|uniref:Histone H4 n=1 Tax=Euplotes crassus TaxID=5936 RepID=A0AAD2D6K4_EUPCR|nr:unnamed protein product [Moneuplotes crassus]
MGAKTNKTNKSKKRGKQVKVEEEKSEYYVSGISDGAIKRLARRGGIKRMGREVYSQAREVFLRFINRLVEDSWSYCECARRKTILPIDVVYALRRHGRNLYGYVYDAEVKGYQGITHASDD